MSSAILESPPVASPAAARRPRVRSTSPALLLVANPNASGLIDRPHLADAAASLLRDFGGRVERRFTTSVEELAAVVAGEERRVVLLGGDGSVHAAANVPGPKPELALVPAGKANNLARGLGVPLDPREAARLALDGAARPVDAIRAETADRDYVAVEGVSVGFHAKARAQYRATNSADVAAGIKAGVQALVDFAPVSIGIETDGRPELLTVSQLFVSNFPLFAFGLRVAPAADPSDGLADVVSIGPRGRVAFLATLKQLRGGTHVGRVGVRLWQASKIRISTGGRSPIIADTTNLGSDTVDLSVERAALALVAPTSEATGRHAAASRVAL